jgi:hypothetical protein
MVIAGMLPGSLPAQTEPSALFELQSTDQGFLLPRRTEAQGAGRQNLDSNPRNLDMKLLGV